MSAGRMARIAAGTVVHIVRNAPVITVRAGFTVRVTGDAGENRVVARIRMAVAAGRPPPRMRSAVYRKLRVVENGPAPPRGGMALAAVSREAGGHVAGIGRAAVLLGMAGIAIGRRPRVYARDVAVRALDSRVGPGQRVPRIAVIKKGRGPCQSVVTDGTILRKTGGDVIGICRAGETREVARHAGRRQGRILPAAVTGRTRTAGMSAG